LGFGIMEVIMLVTFYGVPALILYLLFLYLKRIGERLERVERMLEKPKK